MAAQDTKMKIGNMRALSRLMRRLQKERAMFNMNKWAGHEHSVFEENNVCGTTCCALGHAALQPFFQKQGLQLRTVFTLRPKVITSYEALDRRLERDPDETLSVYLENQKGYDAGAELFGISRQQAFLLFNPGRYRGRVEPRHVADRVDKMIDAYKKKVEKAKAKRVRA